MGGGGEPLGEVLASPLGRSAPPLCVGEDDNWDSFVPAEAGSDKKLSKCLLNERMMVGVRM